MTDALPHRILSFYGDDFTGSTDTMEVAAMAGLNPVLFVDTPDQAAIDAFPDARVIGIAGISRSQDPAWMDAHLPRAFEVLQATGAPIMHYKICSTFDSAPHVGNIGRAAEIGIRVFGNRPVPVLVGAPALKRYLAFGNLFASVKGIPYRIDRHPVMSRHPVTPMAEADLRLHLARQTVLTTSLVDLAQLDLIDLDGDAPPAIEGGDLMLVDTVDDRTLERAGRLTWAMRRDRPIFVLGSSGVEYALVAAWRRLGLLPPAAPLPTIKPVDRMFAVSGSCSPVTAGQIEHALNHGFLGIEIAPLDLIGDAQASDRLIRQSLDSLGAGRDVLIYTARGPDTVVSAAGEASFNDRLGETLGRILRQVLERSGLKRAVVAGGDTSSHATGQLGLTALRYAGPLAPGTPLCHTFGTNTTLAGLELALKGGQIGQDDFFTRAKTGAT